MVIPWPVSRPPLFGFSAALASSLVIEPVASAISNPLNSMDAEPGPNLIPFPLSKRTRGRAFGADSMRIGAFAVPAQLKLGTALPSS